MPTDDRAAAPPNPPKPESASTPPPKPESASTTPTKRDPATTPSSAKKTGRKPSAGAPPPDPTISIPGYTLEKRLGVGGMGDVYLARQTSLDRLVAIKLLPPELARDKAYVEHFLKEARSAAKVTHENIMGAVDCGEANGRYYFVMEYVAGETLHKVIHKEARLPETRALEITRQVARGLRHALGLGLIHRDIKPKNILITAQGTAKLCDFGLAREVSAAENQADEEFLHTTPAYASPEQCRGEANLDHRTDLYSLGVTLFEMLTGRRPFQAATSKELMTKQVTEPPPNPKSLNPSLSDATNLLLLRMLRKQPADRFRDYDELLVAIDKVIGVRLPEAASAAGAQKKKTLLLGGVAAGVGIAIILGIVLVSGGKKDPAPASVESTRTPAVDPEVQKLIDEASTLQARALGHPAQYAQVSAKWKALEEKFRGTPHGPSIATRRLDFEAQVAKEAEDQAQEVLREAEGAQAGGRPGDALRALKRFPAEFSGTAAGSRVAAKELELARAIDGKFSVAMQGVGASLASGKLDVAQTQLAALKASMALDGALRPEFELQIDQMASRIADELALAKKKAEGPAPAPAVVPAPAPLDAKTSPAVPAPADPAVRPAKGPKGPRPAAPAATAAALAILAQAADRTDPTKRGEAAAFFAVLAPKSSFFRAASYFLSKSEKDWKVEPAVSSALGEYFAMPELATADTLTPEQEATILAWLAQKIQAAGAVPADALQFFACAHLDDLETRKGKPDPQVLTQAGLARAPASDLWGLPAWVARIEMAHFLVRPPGLWIARAAESASQSTDYSTRVLGALSEIKQAAFDAQQASDRWKKLGTGVPDPAWTKVSDTLAERFRLSIQCELCLGQGKYTCTACNGLGGVACPQCKATGKIVDPAEGGKVACPTCKGRGAAACATCGGQKSIKCASCDGKKTRPGVAGGAYRWLVDLGLCDACEGEGSLFKGAAWPCPVCDGNGRVWDRFLKGYARMPLWLKTREGRSLWNALRWLARHQAPDGSWGSVAWSTACKEPGCTAPAARPNDFDIGVTSLALVSFITAGLGPESDLELGHVSAGSVIRRGLGWLQGQQLPDGLITKLAGKASTSIKPVFENLLAIYALYTAANSIIPGEAFSDKDKQALKEVAFRALKAALAVQNKGAGWGYTPQAPSDSWVSSWGAAALLSARDAGVDVPRINLQWILSWYDTCTDKKDFHLGYSPTQMAKVNLAGNETFLHHDTLSAFGGLMRMQIEGKATATVATADKLVTMDLPNPDPLRRDFCYWYLATTFQVQREKRVGTGWNAWSQAAVRESMTLQQTADTCALGSWLPDDRWSLMGGTVYATAMNALLMEQVVGLVPIKAPKSK